MVLELDILQSLGIAIIAYILGVSIKNKSKFLTRFFIPSPAIGGILISILVLILSKTGLAEISFDKILQDFFMNIFFATIGLACSFRILKKSGWLGLKLSLAIIILLPLQTLIAIGLCHVFDINPMLGVAMGSTSMTGGIGSAVSFGKIMEASGATNATAIGVASASFGLLAGSLLGGPVANRLIDRYNLESAGQMKTQDLEDHPKTMNQQTLMQAIIVTAMACFVGTFINKLLALTDLSFPYYVGLQFAGILVRNLMEAFGMKLDMYNIDTIGNISLNLFLSLALISLNIGAIVALALPMVVIMGAQAALIALYTSFVTYRLGGGDYDAAVMVAGHCGVGLGQTPNAMANMEAIIEQKGPADLAMFVFPIVLAIAVNLFNPLFITLFFNILK